LLGMFQINVHGSPFNVDENKGKALENVCDG
jgi:hypothetical protein